MNTNYPYFCTYLWAGWEIKQTCLEISMNDWSLTLVETSNCLTGVTKYLQHFGFCEANLQSLVHKVHHWPAYIKLKKLNTVYEIPANLR